MSGSNEKKIVRFGVKVRETKFSKENYAQIDTKVHFRHSLGYVKYYSENPDKRDAIYANPECTIYADEWCQKHRERCIQNMEWNMNFFESLSEEKFNKRLNSFLKRHRKFVEVTDLNTCKDVCGIYIMVLDEYKQVYIGKSETSVKNRIMSHWAKAKEFDRLIFGWAKESRMSIDSFGVLDTTRIFVMETSCYGIDKLEDKFVSEFGDQYVLNRCAGGLNSDEYPSKSHAQLAVMATKKKRKLT